MGYCLYTSDTLYPSESLYPNMFYIGKGYHNVTLSVYHGHDVTLSTKHVHGVTLT